MTQLKIYQPIYYAVIDKPNFEIETLKLEITTDEELQKLAKQVLVDGLPLKIWNDYIRSNLVRRIFKITPEDGYDYLIFMVDENTGKLLENCKKEILKTQKEPNLKRIWNYYKFHVKKEEPQDIDYTVDMILSEISWK